MPKKSEPVNVEERIQRLRFAVRYGYDIQTLRIQAGLRSNAQMKAIKLADEDKAFLGSVSSGLETTEKAAFKEVKRLLKGIPVYEEFLKDVKGVGPAMAGILIGYFDIERADTPSKFWKYAGLAVINGQADRRRKGQKANFNPWLKGKMAHTLAGSFLRSQSDVTKIYYDYKHRLESQRMPCKACATAGKIVVDGKKKVCINCEGTGTGPWGKSKAHRDLASKRYMVKHFLREFWRTWRELEGLEVRAPYAEEYLDKVHHG